VERCYWEKVFDLMFQAKIDTWDYPWTASVWYHGGLTATPNVNMVSNIGFGPDATHTAVANDPNADRPRQGMREIIHPSLVRADSEADRWVFDMHLGGRNLRFPRSWILFPRRVVSYFSRRLDYLLRSRS
jgi:hypothetical protein